MESTIFTYLIKASISLIFFYGLYIACLRKDKFLTQRRFYFMFIIFFSLLFPLFTIEISSNIEAPIPAYWLPQIEIGNTPQESSNIGLDLKSLLLICISIIAAGLILKLIIRIFSIVNLKNRNKSIVINNYNIIELNINDSIPFSFFKWIFIPSKTNIKNLHEIIIHENEHIRQMHSIDVLVSELFCAVFWWNPFAWLLKKEIKLNLEYLADQGVLEKGFDSHEYQYALLNSSQGKTGIPITNNFNVSQLKKRITMMNKKKTPKVLSSKYLLAVPVAALLLLGNVVQAAPELIDFSSNNFGRISPERIAQDPITKDNIYSTVDQIPEYPGGEGAMMKYIKDNLKYPITAFEKGIQGRVIIRFVVEKTGTINNVELIRGIDPACDKEALRVIKTMPDWKPGKMKGESVSVYFTLPIDFKMEANDKANKAGTNYSTVKATNTSHKSQYPDDKPFATVEQMPQFPGGESEMFKFIGDNLKYPVSAQKEGIEGRVTVRFIVGKTGAISDVEVIRGIDPACDQEAVRTIKAMPNWKPGKMRGMDVPVYFTLPIVFKLNKSDSKEEIID